MTEEQLREKMRGELYPRLGGNWTQEQEDATVDNLMSLFTHQLELAKIEQNKFSRGDEFLWFVRKLREFMGDSTSPKYKAFESNFISQYEHKYLEYFSELDLLTKENK